MISKDRSRIILLIAIFTAAILSSIYVGTRHFTSEIEPFASGDIEKLLDLSVSKLESASEIANCRYGIATLSPEEISWLDEFGAGWYLKFIAHAGPAENLAEFVPVIGLKQDRDENGGRLPSYKISPDLDTLATLIANRPGALWIVGNEVDRAFIQGDMMPDIYADAYHELYQFIKENDASAQVGISGLVEITPGRMQYLDMVWDAYLEKYGTEIPVDVWNMHIYILAEKNQDGSPTAAWIALGTDPDIAIFHSDGDPNLCPLDDVYCVAEHDDMGLFSQQVITMRQWMKEHGQQNKPLILSEFSILYPFEDYDDPINPTTCFIMDEYGGCFTQQRVSNFMDDTFDFLENAKDPNLGYSLDGNRLVQQWLWFAGWVPTHTTGGSSNLLVDDYLAMTEVGENFRNEVAARDATINLLPTALTNTSAKTDEITGTVDVALSASVLNNGNHAPRTEFKVTFYSDSDLSQPIGFTTISTPTPTDGGMVGCARKQIKVSTTWNGLATGLHRYWVEVDSDGVIEESQENDNVASGLVLVNPEYSVYVPVTEK